MKRNIPYLILLAMVIVVSGFPAYACPMDAPQVQEVDILNPPQGMFAFKGKIVKISPHGRMGAKPHAGFQIEFEIEEKFQGDFSGRSIKVEFGVCHNMPGEIGDIIPVLALQDKEGRWYAPQFWERRIPSE